jgi:hypothetical protein
LRQVMRSLAAHPIGKKAQANTAAVAQWLTQLPRRHALVRSGDAVGLIHTYDTAPKLAGQELEARWEQVRNQTRAKYCRPRDGAMVEHPVPHPAPQAAAVTAPLPMVPVATPGTAPDSWWGEEVEP